MGKRTEYDTKLLNAPKPSLTNGTRIVLLSKTELEGLESKLAGILTNMPNVESNSIYSDGSTIFMVQVVFKAEKPSLNYLAFNPTYGLLKLYSLNPDSSLNPNSKDMITSRLYASRENGAPDSIIQHISTLFPEAEYYQESPKVKSFRSRDPIVFDPESFAKVHYWKMSREQIMNFKS